MRPLISLDDFDTEPPANINDEDINEDTNSSPVSKPSSVFTQTSIQIILLSSLKTRMEIIQLCNSLNTEPSYEEVSKLGEIMTKECKASSCAGRSLLPICRGPNSALLHDRHRSRAEATV